ncbi:hypothetical protein GCM10010324_68290 [Streptomyces hiroshimensis]|uniref:Uncharacterized protein n=1 Tax=Streptomyces hiroshimensis TaxID=66424 RepID=A0ABQ2ZGD6_9ACTN|nr:hypothetical protein GCM10010324_68290 [Streptomyces hiroshimensis]
MFEEREGPDLPHCFQDELYGFPPSRGTAPGKARDAYQRRHGEKGDGPERIGHQPHVRTPESRLFFSPVLFRQRVAHFVTQPPLHVPPGFFVGSAVG